MTDFIPSYDECLEICAASDGFLFFEMKYVIEGYNVSIFDYKLASPSVFDAPVYDKPYTAYELRGITFVWNSDGTLFKRYLLLKKFFNINQSPFTQYAVIKDYEIESISYKEDGSVVSFIKLPNGNIVAKTKGSFISDQAVGSNKILNNDPILFEFVSDTIERGIVPIFEYVSPYNRVVLKYANTKLVLLQMRDNTTGDYHKSLDAVPLSIGRRLNYDYTLDKVVELSKTEVDSEGYVIMFKNGLMVKQKTQWYYNRHGLYTESLYRENDLIRLILSGDIDDILSSLNDPDKNKEVDVITNKLNTYIKECVDSAHALYAEYDPNNGGRALFSKTYLDNPAFHYAINLVYGEDIIPIIIDTILKKTFRLGSARSFLEKILI